MSFASSQEQNSAAENIADGDDVDVMASDVVRSEGS